MKLHEFQALVKAQREKQNAENLDKVLSVVSATMSNTNERKTKNA